MGRTLRFEDALAALRRHCRNRPPLSVEDEQELEELAHRKLLDKQRLEDEARCPSLRTIPRFYKHRAHSHRDEPNSLQEDVLKVARTSLLHRKSIEEILDEDDLHGILALLKENARERGPGGKGDAEVIDYDGFARIREELIKRGERFRQLFTPSIFLKFPKDQNGCIAILPFFTYVVRKITLKQTRLELSYYDEKRRGYLREKDMENFIFELIPRLPQLNSLQEEFYPFYVFTAVRKFFFLLDPKRTGRIPIRDLLSSQILPELYELRQEQPLDASEAASNWFSMQSALKVYGAYLELDVDQNGMLSKNELSRFGSGMLTDVFIDRVFDEIQTYRDAETGEREMDYKAFLDFVLAMENKNSKQAIQYFWKLIASHHGALDSFVINYFFRAIVQLLKTKKVETPSVDDVKDEIFDMVKSKRNGIITLDDLIQCRQGGTVLSMLMDAAAFWRYDNRESLLIGPDDDDDSML
eukprot:TRINITY_DN9239_c0_g1_i1.p1 TRINITY_DN9239_c0_g1~~TRINITY_DN9239_c0_g1_i1.p1  ORF type:complete len:481 (-),score=126.88 TRINITY_DN9239_c0_g1_i1:51-1460(-)